MGKRYLQNSSKKFLNTLALIFASVALSLCVLACILLPYKIAYADSTQNVLIAPVSNLEGNANAIASTIVLTKGDDEFAIPESYYLSNISDKPAVSQYFQASYCGFNFYYKASERPQTTSVTFSDGVSPSPDLRLTLKDEALTLESVQITPEHTIKFLGYHTTDATQIFVVATLDGVSRFGFAPLSSFEEFVVPYHPIAQAERDRLINSKPAPDPEKGDIIPNTSLALRIVLIIGIAVPAVIIAILLFKPSKNDRSQGKSVMRTERRKGEFDYDSSRTYRDDRYDPRDDYAPRDNYPRDNYPRDSYPRDGYAPRDDYDRYDQSPRDDRR